MLRQGHTYHETMTGYSQQNKKLKMEREGEKGGREGEWRWASMSDHVGDGTWTITIVLFYLFCVILFYPVHVIFMLKICFHL